MGVAGCGKVCGSAMTGGNVLRRLIVAGLLALTLSTAGCATLNPPLTQQCTLFGCKQTGNIVKELGGMIVVMGVLSGAVAAVAKRLSK